MPVLVDTSQQKTSFFSVHPTISILWITIVLFRIPPILLFYTLKCWCSIQKPFQMIFDHVQHFPLPFEGFQSSIPNRFHTPTRFNVQFPFPSSFKITNTVLIYLFIELSMKLIPCTTLSLSSENNKVLNFSQCSFPLLHQIFWITCSTGLHNYSLICTIVTWINIYQYS